MKLRDLHIPTVNAFKCLGRMFTTKGRLRDECEQQSEGSMCDNKMSIKLRDSI